MIHYCGRGHQLAHRESHKQACNAIKKRQKAFDMEEAALHSLPGDMVTPGNFFEQHVGVFWMIDETLNYRAARYALVEALMKAKTYAALETAHGHAMDLLRLSRSDPTEVRSIVPVLKLRLGRDQECYDFCKWWATTGEDSHYDWTSMSNPYLDLKNANVFESPRHFFTRDDGYLFHITAILLLKIRVLTDVRALQNSSLSKIGKKVPQEILDNILGQLVSNSVVAGNKDIMNANDHTLLIENLELQIKDLYVAVSNIEDEFWRILLSSVQNTTGWSQKFNYETLGEKPVGLQQDLDAWEETPGAIEKIWELSKCPDLKTSAHLTQITDDIAVLEEGFHNI